MIGIIFITIIHLVAEYYKHIYVLTAFFKVGSIKAAMTPPAAAVRSAVIDAAAQMYIACDTNPPKAA